MINLVDRDTFEAILINYGVNYQDGSLNSSVVTEMLETHSKNKEHIFKLFGNKLRVEKEIECHISRDEAIDILRDLVKNKMSKNPRFVFARSFLSCLYTDEFTSNVVSRDLKIFDVTIPSGMKVSKALAKFVLEEDVHEVVTLHSMAVQKTKAKGKIVLSIDPCDYITMSSNSSGWRSCHRLDGGEYRTGPLSYLRDKSSVICYLESSRPSVFNLMGKEYTHTNKVWRQIALVSPDLEYSIQERQYPSNNSINATAVSNLFKGLFENMHDKSFTIESRDVEELKSLHIDFSEWTDEYRYYYNDTMHDMYDYANVVFSAFMSDAELFSLNKPVKGEVVYCLNCGHEIYDTNTLYCEDCNDRYDDDDDW